MRIALTAVTFACALLCASAAGAERRDSRRLVVDGNNAFAVDLYRLLGRSDGNLFFSPYSVSTAMAFAQLGAGGETAREIRLVMRYPDYDAILHGGMSRLIEASNVRPESSKVDLRVANALWADDDLDVAPRYSAHLNRFYRVEISRAAFRSRPGDARRTINDWVAEHTKQKILDLLPEGSIGPDTRLVITNAIYFYAPWELAFEKDATADSDFTLADGARVSVPMMHRKSRHSYHETDAYQCLEMRYQGGDMSMLVFLPRERGHIVEIDRALAATTLDSLLARNRHVAREVDVYFPRFRMEQTLLLVPTLQAMGMTLAFGGDADFSGISTKEKIRIDEVVHKAFVDVNETGTEAAAATGIAMIPTSAERPGPEPVTFRADHPFVFVIRDNQTRAILFVGRVMNPRA